MKNLARSALARAPTRAALGHAFFESLKKLGRVEAQLGRVDFGVAALAIHQCGNFGREAVMLQCETHRNDFPNGTPGDLRVKQIGELL